MGLSCSRRVGIHATHWRKDSRVTKQTLLLLRTIEYIASGKAESVETSSSSKECRPTTQVVSISISSASGQRRVRYHTKKIGRPRMKALSKVEPCSVIVIIVPCATGRAYGESITKKVPLLTCSYLKPK